MISDGLSIQRDVAILRRQLEQLENGVSVPCRGRDFVDQDWDYGFCTKQGAWLCFEYISGDKEKFLIRGVDFFQLVHLALSNVMLCGSSAISTENKPIVVLAHGWSPEVGPNYPLIHRLEQCAHEKGWKVIVPDFRPTYKHGERRARSERVNVLYEELLVLLSSFKQTVAPSRLVLVGHSQGGAAVAKACTRKVCSSLEIRGVLMLAPEDPTCHDRMDWRPEVSNLEIVHSVGDATIDIDPIRRLAKKWQCDFTELSSHNIPKGKQTSYGDDIHHDFLSDDLMKCAIQRFGLFLDKCVNVDQFA